MNVSNIHVVSNVKIEKNNFISLKKIEPKYKTSNRRLRFENSKAPKLPRRTKGSEIRRANKKKKNIICGLENENYETIRYGAFFYAALVTRCFENRSPIMNIHSASLSPSENAPRMA